MKRILVILVFTLNAIFSYAQNYEVNIVGFGEGSTKNMATNNALRQCIEKAFGAFIVSNTQVVNDQLVKDSITIFASGNIISYDIISEILKDDLYTISVSAVVSPDNIVKNFKSKGFSLEINGGVYAQNIQKEKFYKEQEPIIIRDFLSKYNSYSIFDSFVIKVGEPFIAKKNLVFQTHYDYENKQRSNISFSRFWEVVDQKSISKINELMSNNLFMSMDQNPVRQFNYMNKWESAEGTKVEKSSDGYGGKILRNPSVETFIIPISYSPHYSIENASILSERLILFLNRISISNPEYESKYGESFTVSLSLIELLKNKKGKNQGSNFKKMVYKLRNPKSIEIINAFAKEIGSKANPNSLKTMNLNLEFSLNSGWFYQPFQNYTYPVGSNNIFNSEKFHLNLADGVGRAASGGYSYVYNFRPCLLLLNVTEEELNKLSKLEFEWK